MRIDVFFTDRVGIAQEILATLAQRALDVSAVEVEPPHVYLEAPALDAQGLEQLRGELLGVAGVQSVDAVAMLPGARFVDCRRDRLETALSIYRQWFSEGQRFSYDPSDIAAFIEALLGKCLCMLNTLRLKHWVLLLKPSQIHQPQGLLGCESAQRLQPQVFQSNESFKFTPENCFIQRRLCTIRQIRRHPSCQTKPPGFDT